MHPFTTELPWPSHQFYINRLSSKLAREKRSVHNPKKLQRETVSLLGEASDG